MREKGQQSAKILMHLVTYRGKKREKCQFLVYVGRCKGKTDICQIFSSFFSMNLSLRMKVLVTINDVVGGDQLGEVSRTCISYQQCRPLPPTSSSIG